MSPGVPHMGYTYLNLLDSPELLQILVTLTAVIKLLLPDFLGRTIVISSRKHAYIILTPLKPHFYIVKLGFTGVYIIFLISAQNHRLWVFVRTASARRF